MMVETLHDFLDCKCKDEYSIEPHGNGYALYFGRCPHRHGYNLLHITEVENPKFIFPRILRGLNQ